MTLLFIWRICSTIFNPIVVLICSLIIYHDTCSYICYENTAYRGIRDNHTNFSRGRLFHMELCTTCPKSHTKIVSAWNAVIPGKLQVHEYILCWVQVEYMLRMLSLCSTACLQCFNCNFDFDDVVYCCFPRFCCCEKATSEQHGIRWNK